MLVLGSTKKKLRPVATADNLTSNNVKEIINFWKEVTYE